MHAVHGGAFFDAVGVRFDQLDQKDLVISTDVLDAWYDPSPTVSEAIQSHLTWLIKTSPPTHSEGLREVLAEVRGIPVGQILLGSGSSSLMFLALPRLIGPGQTALILDPSYGEYAHLFEHVIGCRIKRFPLPLDTFEPDLDLLAEAAQDADLVVLVNPNSPTGIGLPRSFIEALVDRLPERTRLWLDETYIEFMPGTQTAEPLVANDGRVIVSKSMSKVYGLSGLRLGYLVAEPNLIKGWEQFSPPWSVGMLAQLAGIKALQDPDYYRQRIAETHQLRTELTTALNHFDPFRPLRADANYVMVHSQISVSQLAGRMAEQGVFLRNCDSLSPRFRDDHFRVAVKDGPTQLRVIEAFSRALT